MRGQTVSGKEFVEGLPETISVGFLYRGGTVVIDYGAGQRPDGDWQTSGPGWWAVFGPDSMEACNLGRSTGQSMPANWLEVLRSLREEIWDQEVAERAYQNDKARR